MKRKVLKPNIVRGGTAVPIGANYYYMRGRKHEQGGIDVGANPKTGLEVEDQEVMHIAKDKVKVFSAVPFLNGESPAEKVLGGENPNKVFNEQEQFKDVNNINDDGSKKVNRMGGISKSTPFSTGKIIKTSKAKYGKVEKTSSLINTNPIIDVSKVNIKNPNSSNSNESSKGSNNIFNKLRTSINNGETTGADLVGLTSNIAGSLISHLSNRNTLNKMRTPSQPMARQSVKLKTNININPQLDKMRETVAAYERDIDANTASSRVSLARKQGARLAGNLETNKLYGQKENIETGLINQDRLNQQRTSHANVEDYNRWQDNTTDFRNRILDLKGENTTNLISGLNSSIQDLLSRRENRSQFNESIKIMRAAYPNVADELLREHGITVVDKATKKNK